MLKEALRHPIANIALALATGLPLACARPTETQPMGTFTPSIAEATAQARKKPSNNVATKATIPEAQSGQIQAMDIWMSRFNKDLSDNSIYTTIGARLTITQQLPIKGRPFTAEDVILRLVPIDQTVLTVSSTYVYDQKNGSQARRILGITEIRGIRVEYTPQPLTLEQQANNVKQAGSATVKFLARGAYSIWEGKDTLSGQATVTAKTPASPSLSANIPWRERQRTIDLATGKFNSSDFGSSSINSNLLTPFNIATACGQDIMGFSGEQTCFITTT